MPHLRSQPHDSLIRAHNRAMEIIEHGDGPAWDETILALDGHPLQSAAWGDLKAQYGWRTVRLASRDGSAAAQVLVRPLLGLAVAYVPRGPIFSGRPETDGALVRAIARHARRRRAAFIRLEADTHENTPRAAALHELLRRHRFRAASRTIQPRASLTVDLRPAETELLASFSKGHRADIRRAERDGVVVRAGSDEDARILHDLLQATQQRKDFAIHSAAYYRSLLRSFGDGARLFIAEHGGGPVGASLVLAWGGRGIYLAAGSNEQGLKHRAGHLLQWHAIRWARERGALTYDLWGIPDARARLELGTGGDDAEVRQLEEQASQDPLAGVYRFKKGWAASAVRFVAPYDRVFFAPAYWLWQRRRGEGG
jgi:serine/alanine adding enzyme